MSVARARRPGQTCRVPPALLDRLLEMKAAYGSRLSVTQVDFPEEWELADGVIRHRGPDFFQVIGQESPEHGPMILLRQRETALVGLLTGRSDGRTWVLLNARVEPGLHGGCQFSTTIQSTPSNYERRHGGTPTPFIHHFVDVRADSDRAVLHDSWQYDWGQYYDSKIKRFMIVELDADEELPPAPEPLAWVSTEELDALVLTDYGITADLRVAAGLFAAVRKGSHPPSGTPKKMPDTGVRPHDVPLPCLENWRLHERGLDEINRVHGTGLRFVRVEAPSREVPGWAQPLMTVDADLSVNLVACDGSYAIVERSQPGLCGERLWFPAAAYRSDVGKRVMTVRTSAEGGRFLQHGVNLTVVEVRDRSDVENNARWASHAELDELAPADGATSVELRLVMSLLPHLEGAV